MLKLRVNRASFVTLLITFAWTSLASAALEISWYTFDGGGIVAATGGSFVLSGTVGQPDAGTMAGGSFEVTGGFWAATTPLPPSCEGDANRDGIIDPLDVGFVLSRLDCVVGPNNPECGDADVNSDGVVDPLDSGFVLARLGGCP